MSSKNFRDPKLPFDSDKCRCSSCGLYFNSTYAFDSHRVAEKVPGKRMAVTDRRCRTVDELKAMGWGINKTGHWITSQHSALGSVREVA